MSRDRFVHTEKNVNPSEPHGHDDDGFPLASRHERDVYDELKAAGWTVRKHGWPDFIATKEGRYGFHLVRLVEVKGPGDRLRASQKATFEALRHLGIKVEIVQRGRKA